MNFGRLAVPLIALLTVLSGLFVASASGQTTAGSEIVLPPPSSEAAINQAQETVPAELSRESQDMHDFMQGESATSPLGMSLMEGYGEVEHNSEVQGLLVLDVLQGSPAAEAGVRKMHTGTHTALAGAAFVASLFFPPAMLAAAVLESTHVGESYDLIIGVDSERVRSFEDFSERISRARQGELVYLDISRSGRRLHLPVEIR